MGISFMHTGTYILELDLTTATVVRAPTRGRPKVTGPWGTGKSDASIPLGYRI